MKRNWVPTEQAAWIPLSEIFVEKMPIHCALPNPTSTVQAKPVALMSDRTN